jgi:glycosyltransferase involved in cell wall biosynthesis
MDSYDQVKISSLNRFQYPIGVIIPTYNRSDTILTCLGHLEKQTIKDFEVVVVDDGSTDSTPQLLEEYQRHTPLHLRILRQDNSGPARARNVAISVLESPVCIMIGDDIFAAPDFVFNHLNLHRQRPDLKVAALGLTHWSDSGQTVTAFMRWLDESGVQFAYDDLFRGTRADWRRFYTSNLSLKTQLLKENPFNESFPKAAAEDLELGYRLEHLHGLEVVFVPDALAHHLHPTDFRRACRRYVNVGSSMRIFHELWPDATLGSGTSPLRRTIRDFMLRNPWLLPPLTALAATITSVWCPNPIMEGTLRCYFSLGYGKPPSPAGKSGRTRS